MEERIDRIERRVESLEEWRSAENTRTAVADAHFANLIRRFDNLDAEIQNLKSGMWKMLWVVFGSFAAAVVAFIVNGGLVIG